MWVAKSSAMTDKQSTAMVVSNNTISNNDVGGSLYVGSTVVNLPTFDIKVGAETLRGLIEQHKRLQEDDPVYQMVLEELESKIRNAPSRSVIGLAGKLEAAGRQVYL